jgi:hypothetical protein
VKATRREWIGGSALACAGLASAPVAAASAATAPENKSDPQLLSELYGTEQLLIDVYGRVIASGLLSSRVRSAAQRVLGQEGVHRQELERQLRALGAGTPPRLAGPDAIDKALRAAKVSGSVEDLHSEHDGVRLLLEVEMAAQHAYFMAISQLHTGALAQFAAQILASEAQHQTVISEARRPGNSAQAAPYSFIGG